jgi:hypothetical protein
MQIDKPTDDEIWNWSENVKKGVKIFKKAVADALAYPQKVEKSTKFKLLVSNYNEMRQQQGLKRLKRVKVPSLKKSDEQLELDAIRGFDGWHGSDVRFGLDELHEFRVAVDLIDGEEVLVVTNVNERKLQGDAVWERVPVADRAGEGRPNYVEEVLSFGFDCAPSTVPLTVNIRAEDGTSPCRVLGIGKSRKYRAVVAPFGGTVVWTCTGGASIVGSALAELVTVRGNAVSASLDDVVLTAHYLRGLSSRTQEIKLTVADVKKISVSVKASAAMTPGRGGGLADHEFDCTETVEAFPQDETLILLRGDFENVELRATVDPAGTPLAWDVKRASDDAPSLGSGLPTIIPNGVEAKLKTNETGSFFIRVFGDCGDQKFAANLPFKLVPTVLVRATLDADASTPHPENTPLPKIVGGPTGSVRVETGTFLIDNPSTAAIHMSATVDVVSGGIDGRRLIERVFAGWVNEIVADIDWVGGYQDVHSINKVFATDSGTGPFGMFRPGDHPNLVKPRVSDTAPLLDTGRIPNAGTGGDTATLSTSRIRPPRRDLSLGQQWVVEAVDSPAPSPDRHYFLLHPVFSTTAHPVRLQTILFEIHFRAHLCLWTNRSGNVRGGVAERRYGVLHSYKWDMSGKWSIDGNTVKVVRPMSVTISGRVKKDPLVNPKDARCEVCAPPALPLIKVDGRL